MVPDKFYGLTRKSVCNTNDSLERKPNYRDAAEQSNLRVISEDDNWIPMI
jgi:hypothetical protein